jgi:hypothetical protein
VGTGEWVRGEASPRTLLTRGPVAGCRLGYVAMFGKILGQHRDSTASQIVRFRTNRLVNHAVCTLRVVPEYPPAGFEIACKQDAWDASDAQDRTGDRTVSPKQHVRRILLGSTNRFATTSEQ